MDRLPNSVRKNVIAVKSNDEVKDLNAVIENDCNIAFLTFDDPDGKEIFWHSSSHILAHAIMDLYPSAKLAIGPPIENGFYYDIDFEKPITESELDGIYNRMQEIVAMDLPFVRRDITKSEAYELFKDNPFKLELIEGIEENMVSVYYDGDFYDLCRGPHIPKTGLVKAFKLLSIAGAYWRGDEQNPMLQRIYAVSFPKKKLLDEYLILLEEAGKRDHRKLGNQLELFGFDDDIGAGLVLWYPKGALLKHKIKDFWINEHLKRGYELLETPHIAKRKLWDISGHSNFYTENMFPLMKVEGTDFQLKPMNCPFHIAIYKKKIHSYRDFPLKWAELGTVYRYERSGVLHGLMRVRGFTQDDAHIFCTEEQLQKEVKKLIEFSFFMLRHFGFEEFQVFLSTQPQKFVGGQENWDIATQALKMALEENEIDFQIDKGAGVFYGPKIDIKIKDALSRVWQCSTIQIDFNLPERFDLRYTDSDGQLKRPIMVHRALLGSLERFIGVLLEYHGGEFPLWLAPLQMVVIPITNKQDDYSYKIYEDLKHIGFRVEFDNRSEKINSRIRDWELQKIPYMLIIGDKEIQSENIAIRKHKEGMIGNMKLEQLIQKLEKEEKGDN